MNKFSSKSIERLETCDKRLQKLFHEVLKVHDCTILVGFRDEEAQNKAFDEGKTKLRWPKSKHNSLPSTAIDVAPYPIDWNNTKRFYYFAGIVLGIASQLNIKVRFGGDWDQDNDLDDQRFNIP